MNPQTCHKIDQNLTSTDVDQLKFLCIDMIPKKHLEMVIDAKDLFQRLDEQLLLEDGLLIPELLFTIGRIDLLEILKTSKEEVKRNLSKRVSAYRKMLFIISEDMTEENLRSVKFLLELPKAKLGPSASFLDVLIEMEKQQRLGKDNLNELYDVLEKCDRQLAYRIENFKNMHPEQESRLPLQEMSNNEQLSLLNQMETERVDGRRRGSSVSTIVTDSDTPSLSDEYYTMTQRPLGYCLIINNFNFENRTSFRNRKGTEKDKDDLVKLFQKMHFEVEVQNDLEASDIKDVIMKFAKKDHTQMGAFVCCVLSHGEKGAVLGIDGKAIEIRELTRPFAECNTLACKPKLFFIQACQGNKAQNSVLAADGEVNDTEEETYEEDAHIPALNSVPIEADFLIGMATVEHYQSFRHTKYGSIYIQELCKQLKSLCPRNEDILSILTKVNREVSIRVLKGYKQMPEPRYTLTKKLVLPLDSSF
ncbi:caspase-8 [Pseudorasbora parva]|uniref:caspase-8 n=1 Tax=Pseudorasbora parva TaxID=51549 RepID=UPI00351E802E